MSKGNQQSIVLLSSFAGCLGNLISKNAYARVDIKRQIESCFDISALAISAWPTDASDNMDDALAKIHAWAYMMGEREERIPAEALVYMAGRILLNLEFKVRNRFKRELLRKVREAFDPIDKFVDPNKANYLAFEEGDKLLDMLDSLIEWEDDNQVFVKEEACTATL